MSFLATTSSASGEDVRDLMLAAVEHRFGPVNRLPVTIEWLSDNASCYLAGETRSFARDIGLEPRTTPIESSQSNGMAEAFVRTIKRDYVRVSPCPDADTVMHQCQLGSLTTTRFIRTRHSDIVHPVSSSQLTETRDRVRSFGGYSKTVRSLKNETVRTFLLSEFERFSFGYRADGIAPIQNKVGAFLSDPLLTVFSPARERTFTSGGSWTRGEGAPRQFGQGAYRGGQFLASGEPVGDDHRAGRIQPGRTPAFRAPGVLRLR
jgi:hypothetical protein